jgi:uncharacterized protein YndB with AHSA1/START domain
MEQLAVERSIWIAAPRERVWQAVTEPEQIAQWLMPPALGAQMKRGANGELLVCMGPVELPFAVLEALEPPRQATSRSLPDRQLATTYTLEEDNGGTRVTVTVSGFDTLPADVRQDRLLPISMGWEKALTNLNAFVAGADLPFPEGYVAALSGFRRQAQALYAVERSIWIAAPRERVWHAITDPIQIEKWFSPGTPWRMSALEVGGRLFVPNAETGGEMYTQIIEVVDPPHRFVMRSVPEPPEATQVAAYTLHEEQGGTRLVVTSSGYELMPEDVRWNSMEQNAFGFGMMLANVKAVVEGQELPHPGGF